MSNAQYFNVQQSSKLADYLRKFDTSTAVKSTRLPDQPDDRKKRKIIVEDDSKFSSKYVKKEQPDKRTTKSDRSSARPTQSKDQTKDEPNRGEKLRNQCVEKLMQSQFRNINQYLYENPTVQAVRYMTPDLFQKYHQSYSQLVEKWPVKPLDVIISEIEKLPAFNERLLTIADMGCGEALLAKHFKEAGAKTTVHSFDLVDSNELITKASIDNVPLVDNTCDLVVFCLSLMPTNLRDCIIEANRIMKKKGVLYIAEVVSRFEENNFKIFTNSMEQFGFKLKRQQTLQPDNYFVLFKFKKASKIEKIKGLPGITLKPCKYKTR